MHPFTQQASTLARFWLRTRDGPVRAKSRPRGAERAAARAAASAKRRAPPSGRRRPRGTAAGEAGGRRGAGAPAPVGIPGALCTAPLHLAYPHALAPPNLPRLPEPPRPPRQEVALLYGWLAFALGMGAYTIREARPLPTARAA
jgi:hypothetical protein